MKTRGILLTLLVAFIIAPMAPKARAGSSDLAITCDKKRFENIANGGGHNFAGGDIGEASKSEQWGYHVTIENQGFDGLANLDVKYIVFYRHEELGEKGAKKQRKSGSYTISSLTSLGKTEFDTTSVRLTSSSLVGPVGGYAYFNNGAKSTARDTLLGLWIRIYKDGNLFTEYSYPSELSTSEQWDSGNPPN